MHNDRWRKHLQLAPDAEIREWCATAAGLAASGVINLRGLHQLVRLQILIALQRRVQAGIKNYVHWLDRLADFLRAGRHSDLMSVHRTRNETMDRALRALSGAPKPRAMQIIDTLEPARRGVYGGIVGYLDFAGDADTAITIRTALFARGTAHVQAGGGVVADSVPASEDAECQNKAAAVITAVGSAATFRPVRG